MNDHDHDSAILHVLRSHSAYELAEQHLFTIETFCNIVLQVLDLGTLATKIFIAMYQQRQEWTAIELARMVKDYRPNVYVALCRLEKRGFVERVSRSRWRLSKRV